MFGQVVYLALVAIAVAIMSVLALFGFWLHLPEVNRHVRRMALLGWSFSAVGWSLLAAYLLAPIWLLLLVK